MTGEALAVPLAEPIRESDVASAASNDTSDSCVVPLPDGCYRVTFVPDGGNGTYLGTLRVDRTPGGLVVSGDLYWFPTGTDTNDGSGVTGSRQLIPAEATARLAFDIPSYPRKRYHSYLKCTAAQLVSTSTPCTGSLTFEQYLYTQPPTGSFNGRFPAAPGSRLVRVAFSKVPASSSRWPGNYYEGQCTENGVPKGRTTFGWVSGAYRRCTIEVDTLVGSVPPRAVPAPGGVSDEDFVTMLASAGWKATVVYDQSLVPKPPCVPAATDCWSDACLHQLLLAVRRADIDLDAEWRLHLLVVPGHITCSRGKMYDSIVVPREGVVSYSDDGYPGEHSANFGAAEGRTQRSVPRAFIRSAAHELVHGFNQIHQEQEGGADNSIMTTTPSVADVLGGPVGGEPGVFPDEIKLTVNARVRRHMAHFPDPVVRPGGHTFGSWTAVSVPQADDRLEVGPDHLTLAVTSAFSRVELGEPVPLNWVLTNTSGTDMAVPSEITTRSTYAKITVIDASGYRREVPTFVIECEQTRIVPLAAYEALTAGTLVYWSTNGFAFEQPGRYTIEVRIEWTVAGVPLVVRGSADVFVNYPRSDAANAAAANLLHPDVGKWVALGGNATHLPEAVNRLRATVDLAGADTDGDANATADRAPVGALRGYRGLLPDS